MVCDVFTEFGYTTSRVVHINPPDRQLTANSPALWSSPWRMHLMERKALLSQTSQASSHEPHGGMRNLKVKTLVGRVRGEEVEQRSSTQARHNLFPQAIWERSINDAERRDSYINSRKSRYWLHGRFLGITDHRMQSNIAPGAMYIVPLPFIQTSTITHVVSSVRKAQACET